MSVFSKKILVNNVYDNTPGDKAGLKIDDEIMEINGLDIKEYSFMEVKALLRENGKTIELLIKRDGKVTAVAIKLKEII
jgi:C-terminal processing protease CtpA/Prc